MQRVETAHLVAGQCRRGSQGGVVDGQQREVIEQFVSCRAVVVGRIDAQQCAVYLGDGQLGASQLPVASHQIALERSRLSGSGSTSLISADESR
jgi:hypothetical protein